MALLSVVTVFLLDEPPLVTDRTALDAAMPTPSMRRR
jgi:hypothetical protein